MGYFSLNNGGINGINGIKIKLMYQSIVNLTNQNGIENSILLF